MGESIVDGEDDENRIHVENTDNGSTIVIREAEDDDAGEYVCKVSSAEPTLTVEILGVSVFDTNTKVSKLFPFAVKPEVEIEPVPKSGLVTVKEGETTKIACKSTRGTPKSYMKWELGSVG